MEGTSDPFANLPPGIKEAIEAIVKQQVEDKVKEQVAEQMKKVNEEIKTL